jgi:hypothetical protein
LGAIFIKESLVLVHNCSLLIIVVILLVLLVLLIIRAIIRIVQLIDTSVCNFLLLSNPSFIRSLPACPVSIFLLDWYILRSSWFDPFLLPCMIPHIFAFLHETIHYLIHYHVFLCCERKYKVSSVYRITEEYVNQ